MAKGWWDQTDLLSLSIVRSNSRDEAAFSIEELLSAKALRGWRYRQMWITRSWEILGDSEKNLRNNLHDFQQRLANEMNIYIDNHQTFLVEITVDVKVFVMFHDSRIYIGCHCIDELRRDICISPEEILATDRGKHIPRNA